MLKKTFGVNDGHHKKYILESIGRKWKDNRVRLFAEFYDQTRSWEDNLESRPDGIPREQWAAFLNYRLSEKTLVRSNVLKLENVLMKLIIC